jgi:hypothetical protein
MELIKSKLPNSVLVKIWTLSDVDRDGLFDSDEFALAMYLIELKLQGHDLPPYLPRHLIPPSKLKVNTLQDLIDETPNYKGVKL